MATRVSSVLDRVQPVTDQRRVFNVTNTERRGGGGGEGKRAGTRSPRLLEDLMRGEEKEQQEAELKSGLHRRHAERDALQKETAGRVCLYIF
jgi:hypothetical protein